MVTFYLRKVLIILISSLFVLLCAFNLPYMINPTIDNQIDQNILLTLPTSTRTPFQPLPPTPTATITLTPTNTLTPTQTAIFFTPTPTLWNQNLVTPSNQVQILVLGSDRRAGVGFRTDTIILVTINPKHNIVTAVSFPRDLYVNIPGHGMNRINVAMALGGFNLLANTFFENFQVRPDYYILTDLSGFVGIINSLGRIHVNVAQRLSDKCDLPEAVNGYCVINPGMINMNGETALWYIRSRYTTSDFDRLRRSQEVMESIFNRMLSLDVVVKAPELYNQFRNSVETNMPMDTILAFVLLAPHIEIRKYMIGSSETTPFRVPESGAQVLIPNEIAIQNKLIKAIYLY